MTNWKSEETAIQVHAAVDTGSKKGCSERQEVDLIFRHHQVCTLHETQPKYDVNMYLEICALRNQEKLIPVKAGSCKGWEG